MDKISQLQLLCNRPLGLSSEYAIYLQQYLQGEINVELPDIEGSIPRIEAMHHGGSYTGGFVSVLPIHGSLSHRSSWFDLGYETVKGWVYEALENDQVEGIVFEHASGGGEISGLFDFCDFVREASAVKPIWSVVNEHSMSADYCIAAATNRIIAPQSASVGSMGVVMAHMDVSEQMKEHGVKITLVHKGANKVLGNPYEPLSEGVKKALEDSLQAPYDHMIGQISGHLNIDEQELKNTEASIYSSSDALKKGLVHEIMSADDAIQAFSESLSNEQTIIGGTALKPIKKEGTSDENFAEIEAAYKSGQADGKKEAEDDMESLIDEEADKKAKAEIERREKIVGSKEAEGREDLANHLYEKGETVEDALKTLAFSPKKEVDTSGDNGSSGSSSKDDVDDFSDGRQTDDVDGSSDLGKPKGDSEGNSEDDEEDDNKEKFGKRTASVKSISEKIAAAQKRKVS